MLLGASTKEAVKPPRIAQGPPVKLSLKPSQIPGLSENPKASLNPQTNTALQGKPKHTQGQAKHAAEAGNAKRLPVLYKMT